MAERRTYLFGLAGIGLLVLVGALVVIGPGDFFLPEQSTTVNETGVDGTTSTNGTELLDRGNFTGLAGHDVSGTVALMRDDEGLYLRFEDYQQTQGPDVFVYVTPSETPDTASEIDAGQKVKIDGGADGGESTKEGTFTQRLPDGVSVEDVDGVGVWCERFATPFGMATLSDSG